MDDVHDKTLASVAVSPSRRMRRAGLLVLSALYLVVVGFASCWARPSADPLPIDLYVALLFVCFLLYAAIIGLILTVPHTKTVLSALLVVVVLSRVMCLLGPARENPDVWRYIWDGHVLAAGYNPFAHTPDDSALDAIRDPEIYGRMEPAYNPIHTVYGPAATICFALSNRIPGDPAWNIRALMTEADLVTFGLLLIALRGRGRSLGLAFVYGLNPLLLDSFAQRGQVEAIMLVWLVLAIVLWQSRRWTAAGIALAVAALVKPVPLLLIPLFARAAWDHNRSACGRFLAGAVATIGLGGLPLLAARSGAFEGLWTYATQWQSNGSLFDIVAGLGGTTIACLTAVAVVLLTIGVCMRRISCVSVLSGRCLLVLGMVLLWAPAVFPWYVTWLLPFVVLTVQRAGFRRFAGFAFLWSGTVLLWYGRFLVYPPTDEAYWPFLADHLGTLSAHVREPWRLLEYLPLILLVCPARSRLPGHQVTPLRRDGHIRVTPGSSATRAGEAEALDLQ